MDKKRIGWSLASNTGGVTANMAHLCPSSPDSDFFGGVFSLQEIGEGGAVK